MTDDHSPLLADDLLDSLEPDDMLTVRLLGPSGDEVSYPGYSPRRVEARRVGSGEPVLFPANEGGGNLHATAFSLTADDGRSASLRLSNVISAGATPGVVPVVNVIHYERPAFGLPWVQGGRPCHSPVPSADRLPRESASRCYE